MKNTLSSKILNLVLIFGIILTFIALIGTPLVTTAFLKSAFSILNQTLVFKISACIYICAIPYMISLFKLKKLCGLVVKNRPFSIESVNALKTIAICAFVEILLVGSTFLYLKRSTEFFMDFPMGIPLIPTLIICVPVGLLCLVFSELFHNAMEIKEENDQTI